MVIPLKSGSLERLSLTAAIDHLSARGLNVQGTRFELLVRLHNALAAEATSAAEPPVSAPIALQPGPPDAGIAAEAAIPQDLEEEHEQREDFELGDFDVEERPISAAPGQLHQMAHCEQNQARRRGLQPQYPTNKNCPLPSVWLASMSAKTALGSKSTRTEL